jgi:aryl-alcohol dehydrogenase-like predicted oxidoreductase
MNSRKLGEKGFDVSEIGLGCWQIGGDWGNNMDKEKAFSIFNEAIANGITFFDTADVYGNGYSETHIGEYIRNTGARIKVATKFGRDANIYPNNYTEKSLRDCVDASRKRLGMDCIDLLQLHCIPTEELRKGKIFDYLRKLKSEGIIAHFGASVESVEEGLICLEQDELLSLQVIYNIFRQKLTKELFPKAKEKGVGIIVRLPLASGLLSGKFTKVSKFAPSDHRNFNKNGEAFNVGETFAGLPFEKGVELSDKLKEFCPADMDMVQMSLRWILNNDAVSTIIAGASSAQQVAANASVSKLPPLSKDLMDKLETFYTENVHQHIRGPY